MDKPPPPMKLSHINQSSTALNKKNGSSDTNALKSLSRNNSLKKSNATKNHPLLLIADKDCCATSQTTDTQNDCKRMGDGENRTTTAADSTISASANGSIFKRMHHMYSTLPKMKKTTADQQLPSTVNRPPLSIPMRTTSDGTTIYYICDLPKNVIKGL